VRSKQKNIFILIITWAGLLMAVLYSPIGSPDLYTTDTFFAGNQGVNFNGKSIPNSSDFNGGSSNSNEINIPDYNSTELKSSHYAVANYPTTGGASSTSYSVQTQSYQTDKSGSSAVGGGGSTFISNNSSRSGANSSAVSMTSGGITTLTTNITSNSTRQDASASTTGGTDPGGDPIGPPIPVPDGFGFLLLLAVSYAILKKYFLST